MIPPQVLFFKWKGKGKKVWRFRNNLDKIFNHIKKMGKAKAKTRVGTKQQSWKECGKYTARFRRMLDRICGHQSKLVVRLQNPCVPSMIRDKFGPCIRPTRDRFDLPVETESANGDLEVVLHTTGPQKGKRKLFKNENGQKIGLAGYRIRAMIDSKRSPKSGDEASHLCREFNIGINKRLKCMAPGHVILESTKKNATRKNCKGTFQIKNADGEILGYADTCRCDSVNKCLVYSGELVITTDP